jgi:HK97 family phage major capsid protein
MNRQMKDQLDNVRSRINAARDEKARLTKQAQDAQADFASSTSDAPVGQHPDFLRAQQAHRDLAGVNASLESLKSEEMYYLQRIAGEDGGILMQSFLQDPQALAELNQIATSKVAIGRKGLGEAVSRDQLVEQWSRRRAIAADDILDYSPTGAARIQSPQGIVPQLRRQLTVLDLIPTDTLNNNVYEYVQETGSFNTASETEELALRDSADLELVDAEARARTISHWFKMSRQALADIGGLQATVQNRLLYGVRRRLEDQIISGNGEGEYILGILNTTGIASVDYSAVLEADATLDGIVDVILSDAEPSGVVLNPADWQSMQVAKADSSGVYLSGGPFGSTPRTLWGLPVVLNAQMPAGQALVGDFNIGAVVLVRESPNILLSDSDQDDFVRGRVTIMAEGRFALAVPQPTAFAVVQLTDPS